MSETTTQQSNPECSECGCKDAVKKGKRRNRFRTLQLFQCIECLHKFTGALGKHRTYPLKYILEGISTYNLGHSLTETQARLRKRIHADVPARTIQAWLSAYKPLTPYSRLRAAAKKLFAPETVVRSFLLRHRQVYQFQVHQAKLELLLQPPSHREFAPISEYLRGVGDRFPHGLFESARDRSSSFQADYSGPQNLDHPTSY